MDLKAFQQAEFERGRERARDVVTGQVVTNIRALYDDSVFLTSHRLAFHRPRAPLWLMLATSHQVAAFIPPVSERRLRFLLGGTNTALLMELVRHNLVVPVIGWPTEYSYAHTQHLESLLGRRPVSMPARGYGMVDGAGLNDLFACGLADPRLAELSQLVEVQQTIRPNPALHRNQLAIANRTKEELVNNYVDLCLFGHYEEANEALSLLDPLERTRALLTLAEGWTYPKLIGMGGIGQYVDQSSNPQHRPISSSLALRVPIIQEILITLGVHLSELRHEPARFVQTIRHLHDSDVPRHIIRLAQCAETHGHEKDGDAIQLIQRAAAQVAVNNRQIKRTARYLSAPIVVAGGTIGAAAVAVAESLLAATPSGSMITIATGAGAGAAAGCLLAEAMTKSTGFAGGCAKSLVAKQLLRHPLAFDLWKLGTRIERA